MFTTVQQKFIEEGLDLISSNPSDRLNIPAKTLIENKNFICDGHCHLFDGQCVDASYFLIRLLDIEDNRILKKIIEFITNKFLPGGQYKNLKTSNYQLSKEEALEIIYSHQGQKEIDKKELGKLFAELEEEEKSDDVEKGFDRPNAFKRIIRVYKMMNQGKMQFVYNEFLKDSITNTNAFKDKDLLTVVLGMDLESGWNGSNIKSFSDQLKELLELSLNEPIIPFFPIHPNRALIKERPDGKKYKYNELYDLFLDYFGKGNSHFFGVKLYPSLGYHPGHESLAPIYKICEECCIPITVHCGGETISSFENKIKTNIFGKTLIVDKGTRKENAKFLNEADNWFEVLKRFKYLKVNFAHFGGNKVWEKSEKKPHRRVLDILLLMEKYEGVYTDFSFTFGDPNATRIFCNYLNSKNPKYEKFQERTMFGTDYWVVLPESNIIKDQSDFIRNISGYTEKLLKENIMSFLLKKIKQ